MVNTHAHRHSRICTLTAKDEICKLEGVLEDIEVTGGKDEEDGGSKGEASGSGILPLQTVSMKVVTISGDVLTLNRR